MPLTLVRWGGRSGTRRIVSPPNTTGPGPSGLPVLCMSWITAGGRLARLDENVELQHARAAELSLEVGGVVQRVADLVEGVEGGAYLSINATRGGKSAFCFLSSASDCARVAGSLRTSLTFTGRCSSPRPSASACFVLPGAVGLGQRVALVDRLVVNRLDLVVDPGHVVEQPSRSLLPSASF